MKTDLNKAERLAVAAVIAPTVRERGLRGRNRPVKVYNRETGEVVREATLAEVHKGVLEALNISHLTQDGVKPKEKVCPCGRGIIRQTGQRMRPRCPECYKCVCGKKLSKYVWCATAIALRKGGSPACRVCTLRRMVATRNPKRGATSPYLGVGRRGERHEWYAQVVRGGRTIHIGYFFDELEAAKAYDMAVRDMLGPTAPTNGLAE